MPLNELIPIINKLQEAFAPLGIAPIDLPQIAVVGSQSSGKSSVLEALVGYDFLPRGTGICTRRPLILQLINENVDQDWAEFSHSPKKLYSFEEVKKEIELETAKVAGAGKAVSAEPIILRVHSKTAVDLTLVDLPGLTKVPVGDQPQDIANQIRKMVLEVIERPNCIILAVSAANQDIANSDGLQLAREVDPNGERTVGVLTKLDIMDAGTDARDVLEGRTYPLRHGYIGVVNRSQRDIDQGKSMMASMASEKKFFSSHPAYSRTAHEQGSLFLSKRLNAILEGHIREHMPDISKKIKTMLRDAQEELQQYGGDGAQTVREQRAIVVSAIHRFCESYKEAMEGRGVDSEKTVLYGPAVMRDVFTTDFPTDVRRMDSRTELSDEDIHIVRRNAVGVKADLFVPNAAFETLVKRLIQKLEDPAATCVRLVSEQIKQVIQDVMRTCKEIGRYEHLKERVWQECMKLLGDKQREAAEFVQNIINMEVAYLNTDNPEFDTFRSGVYRLMAAHQGMAAAGGASEGSAGDRAAQPKPEAPAPDVTREGMVDAWVREKWKAHFVRIGTDRQLSLYVNKSDLTPIRSNALEECTVRQDAALGKTCLEISLMKRGWLSNGQETIRLRFASAEDAAAWSKSFQAASAAAREDEEERPESPRSSAAPGGGGGGGRASSRQSEAHVRISSIGGLNSPPRRFQSTKAKNLTEREVLEANVLRQLLEHYFRIVQASVIDSVPKAIMLTLVNSLQNNVYTHLMGSIYLHDDEALAALTRESEEVVRRRMEVIKLNLALRKAIAVMRDL